MEAIALAAVIRKAADIAGFLAAEGASFLSWLQEDIIWICREMDRIQRFLRYADANPSGSDGLENLRREIRDLAYDMEDIMDAYFPNIATHTRRGFLGCLKRAGSCFRDQYTAIGFSLEVKVMRKKVEDINRAKITFNVTDMDQRVDDRDTWDPRRPFLHVDEPNIVGLDHQISYLVGRLQSAEVKFTVISIIGSPGIGKTTLGKEVFKSATARIRKKNDCKVNGFVCSALVYVSQEPDVKEILRDIARQVGLEKKSEHNLEANLFAFLRARRYLIFLDDIWSSAIWDALKIGIPINSGNGSRIILTSRNTAVGRYVGGESSLNELLPLNPDDSWELFCKMVMPTPTKRNEASFCPVLEKIGREIVTRCCGLPLAIVFAGGLLLSRERTEHSWRGVLESIHQIEEKCSKSLALSYKDLPIELKPCFLYFGLLPANHEVSAFRLINLWVAEKFIVASAHRSSEEIGWDCLNNLADRNLIQVTRRKIDGRIRSCRIHDLLHALCLSIGQESNFFNTSTHLPSNSAHRVRRVSTCGITEISKLHQQTSKLRALVSFSEDEGFTEEILKGERLPKLCIHFSFLRVLVLFTSTQTSLPLPNELGSLSHLSYVEMRGFRGSMLPATVRNLKNLLTLDVRDQCESLRIPISIWKLEQLRHIRMCDDVHFYNPLFKGSCRLRTGFFSSECSLPNLQTLLLVHGNSLKPKWLHKFPNLVTLGIHDPTVGIINVLSNTLSMSKKLETLRLSWSLTHKHQDSTTKLDLSQYEHLSKVHLEGHGWNLPKPIKFPTHLKKLTLKFTELEQRDLEILKKLPELKILKLDYYSYKGRSLFFSGAKSFRQLEVLEIRYLPFLEELIAEDGGIPRLKELIVRYCNKLKTVSDRLQMVMIPNYE